MVDKEGIIKNEREWNLPFIFKKKSDIKKLFGTKLSKVNLKAFIKEDISPNNL